MVDTYVDYDFLRKNELFVRVYENPLNYYTSIMERLNSAPIEAVNFHFANVLMKELPLKFRLLFISNVVDKINKGEIEIRFQPNTGISEEKLIKGIIWDVAIPWRGERSSLTWYFWHPMIKKTNGNNKEIQPRFIKNN